MSQTADVDVQKVEVDEVGVFHEVGVTEAEDSRGSDSEYWHNSRPLGRTSMEFYGDGGCCWRGRIGSGVACHHDIEDGGCETMCLEQTKRTRDGG